jgi:L-alanine-DL-glutamate epimerase-like enolase superfamily enzyme
MKKANMKILSIETIPLRLPLKTPFHMSNFSVFDMHYVLVVVTTNKGIIGYGEATPSWDVNGETPESIDGFIRLITNKKMLGYSLIGEEIDSLEQLNNLIDTIINPIDSFSYIAENSSAKAALEQALYSAYALHKQTSLANLLNMKKGHVPFTNTISIAPVDETVQSASVAIKNGARIIRLKIGKKNVFGSPGYQRDIDVINRIAKLLPNKDIKLIADANQGFQTVKETVQFCKHIGTHLAWLEQPILAHNLLGFKEIKKYTKIPLMADESVSTYKDLQILLQLKAVDYINIKLMKTGGYRGALKFINLANQYGVNVHVGSMIESAYGIYMGFLLANTRSNIISTDLNVYDLLEKQYCAYGYKQNKSMITHIDVMPRVSRFTLKTFVKKYEYKKNS